MYVNQSGNLVWDDRDEGVSIQWIFNGSGSFNNDYGINIVSIDSQTPGIDYTWPRVVLEYQEDNFSVSESAWTPGDGSIQDKIGERTYSESVFELDSTQAQTVADRIRAAYSSPKKRWIISTVFTPHLELKDRVEINYLGEATEPNAFVLGLSALGGTSVLSGRAGSINLIGVTAKIIGIEINLNNFDTSFELMEL